MKLIMTASSLSEKIKTKSVNLGTRSSHFPLSYRLGENQWAVIFRFGVVVTVGLNEREIADILSEIKPHMENPYIVHKTESIEIETEADEDIIDSGNVCVKELTREHVLIIADVLGKSVMLERYESMIQDIFTNSEPLAEQLMKGSGGKATTRELKRTIGATLMTQQVMIGRVEVDDKPEVLWEHPELEKMFARLEAEYEIKDRKSTLEKKLNLVNSIAETQLGLLHNTYSMRVEWYIVILIVFEIFLNLYEMFFKH